VQAGSPEETLQSQPSSTPTDSQHNLGEVPDVKDEAKDMLTPILTYLGRYSSQAFPRYLGLQLRSEIIPKPGPYVFNLSPRGGYYEHVAPGMSEALCAIIDLKTTKEYLEFFFGIKFATCGFMNKELMLQRCDKHWSGQSEGLQFEVS
jgi:hypothetical protein